MLSVIMTGNIWHPEVTCRMTTPENLLYWRVDCSVGWIAPTHSPLGILSGGFCEVSDRYSSVPRKYIRA